jgi:hypothetical protein
MTYTKRGPFVDVPEDGPVPSGAVPTDAATFNHFDDALEDQDGRITTLEGTPPGGGVTDHGALTGLSDDDHPQYHNNTRGDARYSQLGHNHDATYVNETDHTKAAHDALGINAATLDGMDSSDFATAANLTTHTSDSDDAHDASAISYAGGTGMSASTVEAAIDELANEKADAATLETALFGVSADRGNGSITLVDADEPTQLFNTPLTATRSVTLLATGASTPSGRRFRIVRGSAATGAFDLEVRNSSNVLLATLAQPARAVELTHDGSDWQITDFVSDHDLQTHLDLGLATSDSVTNHVTSETDAHPADSISIADAGAFFSATDVEGALQEIGAGGIGGGGGAATEVVVAVPIFVPHASQTIHTNTANGIKVAETEFREFGTHHRQKMDLSGASEVRFTVYVDVAANAGAKMGLQYALSEAGPWKFLDGSASGTTTANPQAALNTASTTVVSTTATLPSEAKADVFLRAVTWAGDGTTIPKFGIIVAQFTVAGVGATAATVPVVDTGGYYTGNTTEDVLQEIGASLTSGGHDLGTHNDTDFASVAPVAGDTLRFNGTDWVPAQRAWRLDSHSLPSVTATTISSDAICTENNFDLRRLSARVQTPSSSGNITIEIYRGTSGTGSPTLTLIGTITINQAAYRAVNVGISAGTVLMQQDEFLRAVVTGAGTGAAGLTVSYRGFLL